MRPSYDGIKKLPYTTEENYKPVDTFIIGPTIKDKILGIVLFSYNNPTFLQEILLSLQEHLKHTSFPRKYIRFYAIENSDSRECITLFENFYKNTGLDGSILFFGQNVNRYRGLFEAVNLVLSDEVDIIWHMEDNCVITSKCPDLLPAWLDVFNDPLVDGIFIQQWWHGVNRIYSEEIFHTRKLNIPYRFTNTVPGSFYGKFALPYVMKSSIWNKIGGPIFDYSIKENIEIYYCKKFNSLINSVVFLDEQFYPLQFPKYNIQNPPFEEYKPKLVEKMNFVGISQTKPFVMREITW
jgi:hypothetical protein